MRSLVEQDCRVFKIHRVESVPLQQWMMSLFHEDKNSFCNQNFACVRADMINDKPLDVDHCTFRCQMRRNTRHNVRSKIKIKVAWSFWPFHQIRILSLIYLIGCSKKSLSKMNWYILKWRYKSNFKISQFFTGLRPKLVYYNIHYLTIVIAQYSVWAWYTCLG